MTLLNLALYMTYQTGKKGNNMGESDKHNSLKASRFSATSHFTDGKKVANLEQKFSKTPLWNSETLDH